LEWVYGWSLLQLLQGLYKLTRLLTLRLSKSHSGRSGQQDFQESSQVKLKSLILGVCCHE
jgi:hypothetical protein